MLKVEEDETLLRLGIINVWTDLPCKNLVTYQSPFCTETVPNGLFSSPGVPDLYLWIQGGNSSQFSIGAEVPKLYPVQLGRTAVLPRNQLGNSSLQHSVPQFRNCTLQKEGIALLRRYCWGVRGTAKLQQRYSDGTAEVFEALRRYSSGTPTELGGNWSGTDAIHRSGTAVLIRITSTVLVPV